MLKKIVMQKNDTQMLEYQNYLRKIKSDVLDVLPTYEPRFICNEMGECRIQRTKIKTKPDKSEHVTYVHKNANNQNNGQKGIRHRVRRDGTKISRVCRFDSCLKYSSMGYIQYDPMYCKIHAQPDMVNVVTKSCDFQGCKRQAHKKRPSGRFCAKHAHLN